MSDEDILVEYELDLAAEGEKLKECPRCSLKTHRKECPECEIELSGDMQADDVFARLEAGEDIDLNAALRGEQWEPVPRGA